MQQSVSRLEREALKWRCVCGLRWMTRACRCRWETRAAMHACGLQYVARLNISSKSGSWMLAARYTTADAVGRVVSLLLLYEGCSIEYRA